MCHEPYQDISVSSRGHYSRSDALQVYRQMLANNTLLTDSSACLSPHHQRANNDRSGSNDQPHTPSLATLARTIQTFEALPRTQATLSDSCVLRSTGQLNVCCLSSWRILPLSTCVRVRPWMHDQLVYCLDFRLAVTVSWRTRLQTVTMALPTGQGTPEQA